MCLRRVGTAGKPDVVLFQILNGSKAGASEVARRFPFRIGRASGSHLCLEDAGVWDEHLVIQLRPDRGVEMVVKEPALATVNGEPVKSVVLHSGDIIGLGSLQLRFSLSPSRQRSLSAREFLTWLALALLCAGQAALIYWLS